MLAWIALRAAAAVFLIWGVASFTFLLIHAAPGDPSDLYLPAGMAPEARAALRSTLGLDRSLPGRYLRWMSGVARGDMGISLIHHRPVRELLRERLPATMALIVPALALQLTFGAGVGILAAARRGGILDVAVRSGAILVYSIPIFWLGALLIVLFSIRLDWLPAAGARDPFAGAQPALAVLLDRLRHLTLPVGCLALGSAAWTARLARSVMISALASPCVRAARARGASHRRASIPHAFVATLRPIVVTAGISLPAIVSGSVIVESLFAWPGMGLLSVEAVFARDYPVVLGSQLLATLLVIAGGFVADLGLLLVPPGTTGRGQAAAAAA